MRRFIAAGIIMLALILAAGMLSGCVWLGDLLHSFTPEPTEAPVTEPPEGYLETEEPDPTTASEAQAGAEELLARFYRAWTPASLGLTEAVCEADKAEREAYLSLMREEALIAEVYSALRMIERGEGVSEGENGDWSTYADGSFECSLADGASVSGRPVAANELSCEVRSARERTSIALTERNGAFTAVFTGSREARLELRSGAIRYRSERGLELIFENGALSPAG